MLTDLWADLHYAVRTLVRSPAFSAAAVLTIALGVGINTGIFTVVNGVLFRDLPGPRGDELVSLYQTIEGVPERYVSDLGLFSTAEFEAYRDRTQTLRGVLGHSDPTRTTLGGASPEQISGLLVTCTYFDVLAQQPALGRGLRPSDCAPGADPVAVLGHGFWVERLGADPTIVGRTLSLNNVLVTIVGIATEATYGGAIYRSAYFAPIALQPLLLPNEDGFENPQTSWLFLIGRRADGVGIDAVRAELGLIAAQIDADEPGRRSSVDVERATPLSIPLFRRAAVAVGAVIMAAFGLVLLIACANVANLVLARAAGRTGELALRISLGATRWRVLRQLLAESLLISAAGGTLGALLSLWSFQLLVRRVLHSFVPAGVPPIELDATPDVRVLIFTLLLTAGAGLLFGLLPALQASKPDLNGVIKQSTTGLAGEHGRRLRSVLIGAQAAVCMTLMIGAALLLRGLYATQVVDPGFAFENVAVVSYDLFGAGYDAERATGFQQQLIERVGAAPGIESAAFVDEPPLEQGTTRGAFRLPDQAADRFRTAELNFVTEDYFQLVDIAIVRGRNFLATELAGEAATAIVTESTAATLWPGLDPIGQSLVWRTFNDSEVSLRVVGVARDAQVSQIGQVDPLYVYLPATPASLPYLTLLVAGRSPFDATAASVRQVMAGLDPGIAATILPLESNIDYLRGLSSIVAAMAGALGVLALLLASVGIYGVVAYFVASRLREIGIRLALGASRRSLVGLVLWQTLRPAVIGMGLGIGAAMAVSRILTGLLFGVSPADPFGVSVGIAFVLGVTLLAGLLASRRAASADPLVPLRHD